MADAVSRRALLFGLPAAARARLEESGASGRRPQAGDHRVLGRRVEPAAERLVRVSAVGPGRRLLDLAAGDGSVALAAARAGADVVAIEPDPGLVEQGQARSQACGLAVDWRGGALESLPLEDACFDCVASNFGVIHARDSRRAVDEIDRVLRPGGSVLITAWASRGVMGRVLRLATEVEGRRPSDARPERWGRYEGVQLAFSRFPGFQLHDLSLHWEFADADAVWEELGPHEDVRERFMQLVEPLARREGDHVVLDVAYVLVVADKPRWAEAPTQIGPA